MNIADLITPQGIVPSLRVASKKQLLQELAKRAAAHVAIEERVILETLMEREKLGSTGIGGGTAVPHGRLANLPRIFALFARLEKPIPFDSVDDQPVDLVFLLLTPESAGADHLKALACVSRLLRDRATCAKLRGTDRADALYAILTDRTSSNAA